MAAATLAPTAGPNLETMRRRENFFFSAMALLILTTVLVGFARTYFLAGVFRAPLPSLIVHIHGALFSTWILLLVVQVSLVSAGPPPSPGSCRLRVGVSHASPRASCRHRLAPPKLHAGSSWSL